MTGDDLIRLAISTLVLGSQFIAAQTFTTLFSFKGQTDGAYSSSGLVADGKGNLYGTTQAGGLFNFGYGGTVFSINRKGQETVLHSFCSETNCADGSIPLGGVTLDSSGNLYGATLMGGANNFGIVFKIDNAGNESVLYSFQGLDTQDGNGPATGNLVRDAGGNLYGATLNGGLVCSFSASGCGIVYKIDPEGRETILHRFTGGVDGGLPPSDLTPGPGRTLYGTTFRGGRFGCGTIFKITAKGGFHVLYHFSCSIGGEGPNAGVVSDASGMLYGTTAFGGTWSRGTVFKYSPTTGIATFLYNFQGGTIDGCAPGNGNVTVDAGSNIYGTTPDCGAHGDGILFKVDPSGNETILHNFDGSDGEIPQTTLLLDKSGNLFGTTYFSDNFSCCGTVFELTP